MRDYTADQLIPFIKALSGKKCTEWAEDEILKCALEIRNVATINMGKSSKEGVELWSNFRYGNTLKISLLILEWSSLLRERPDIKDIVDPYYIVFDHTPVEPGNYVSVRMIYPLSQLCKCI
jgi:hypothetical protein